MSKVCVVEDLILMIQANLGVAAGAINSTYQKIRLENVCRRLNLTPLCYLWERNQLELFDEMIAAGIDAILIKVAAVGLNTQHLGLTLPQVNPLQLLTSLKKVIFRCANI